MFGLLNLDKPPGITSRDVVNRVQRLVRPAKVGHAGTLDPLARGVLILGVGPATRLLEYIQRQPKQYRAEFLLGRTSDTEDIEGQVQRLPAEPIPASDEILRALPEFTGNILQRPPQFSALKVGGRRAYDLARAGQTADLAPRPVRIDRLDLLRYEYPQLELRIVCSAGTYVRSLGRDLAERLGTGAVMSSLVREAVGPFQLADAVGPATLSRENLPQHLLPAVLAVHDMPAVVVSPDQQARLRRGQDIPCGAIEPAEEAAAVDPAGNLLAILRRQGGGRYRPVKNLF